MYKPATAAILGLLLSGSLLAQTAENRPDGQPNDMSDVQGGEQTPTEQTGTELPDYYLQLPAKQLGLITISASRTEQPVFTTPAAVSTISRTEIKRALAYGYQDLFKDIPGVVMIGGSRRIAQEPVIRGFQDEQVVMRIDGARQNFNQSHRGRFFIDPSLLKRIEVLRGGASAIYGSGALGGVISLTTMDPDDYLGSVDGVGANLGAAYHANGDETSVYGTVFAQTGAVDALVSYAWRDAGEDLQAGDGQVIAATRDEIGNGLIKLGLDLSPYQRLEFSYSKFNNTGRNPPNANGAASATNLVDRDTSYEGYRLNYDLTPVDNDLVDLHAVFYRNEATVEEYRFDDGRQDYTEFTTDGLDVYNASRFGFLGNREAVLTYGFEYYMDEQFGRRNGGPRPQFPAAEARYKAYYVQAILPLTERFELVPGVRYDSFAFDSQGSFVEREDNEVTPRLSAGYQVSEDVYLWGGYAEAFRAPSLTELYASGVHFVAPIGANQVVINELIPAPDLKPEKAQTWEAGLRIRGGDPGKGFVFNASAYRSEVRDYVETYVVFISGPPQFDPVSGLLVFPGITAKRNVNAQLQGLEAGFDWWTGAWSGAAVLSVMQGENTDTGEGIASIPQDNLVLKASRWFAGNQFRAGARLTLANEQDDVPADSLTTEGWQTLDLFVGWLPRGGWLEGVELRAGIDNVLDEKYRVHPNGIPAPGRSFKISVAKHFQ